MSSHQWSAAEAACRSGGPTSQSSGLALAATPSLPNLLTAFVAGPQRLFLVAVVSKYPPQTVAANRAVRLARKEPP
jgi:hypothetical protein